MTTDTMYMGGESDWKQMWPRHYTTPSEGFSDSQATPVPTPIRKAFLDRLRGSDEPYKATERQVGGDHYKRAPSNMQPWDIIDAWGLDFYAGNVVKYVLRHQHKAGVEDLRKARHYLDKMIEDANAS